MGKRLFATVYYCLLSLWRSKCDNDDECLLDWIRNRPTWHWRVRVHSRSLEIAPFKSFAVVSYLLCIVTKPKALSCIVSEIKLRYIGRKSRFFTTPAFNALVSGVARWLSGRASDLRSKDRGFEPRQWRCCATYNLRQVVHTPLPHSRYTPRGGLRITYQIKKSRRQNIAIPFGTEKATLKKFHDKYNHFDRIPACETDRRTDRHLATAHSIVCAWHGKNRENVLKYYFCKCCRQ